MSEGTEYFRIANGYLGWGDTCERGLWFIGLEEATEWTENQLREHAVRPEEISPARTDDGFAHLGPKGRSVRALTCRIAHRVSRQYASATWQRYCNERLWRPGCGLVQVNFYPLGKASWNDWPEYFEEWFGFSSGQRTEYERVVAETRHVRLREVWAAARPQATICFGVHAWPAARRVFGLDPDRREFLGEERRIEAYAEARVILTPFFSYRHFGNADAAAVAETLRQWSVVLP